MIDVVWWSDNADAISRGYWDQSWLEGLLTGPNFCHHARVEQVHEDGAIVIIPARWNAERVLEVNDLIARLQWVLLVLTGDEENNFPRDQLVHPNMRVWVQTPKLGTELPDERYVGDMVPTGVGDMIDRFNDNTRERDLDWFFAGQVNTPERFIVADILSQYVGLYQADLHTTDTFGSGYDTMEYVERLERAKIVPCPGGPFTPDTFRVFEALEAGCVPLVHREDYWHVLLGDTPLRQLHDWAELPSALDEELARWPANAVEVDSWWLRYKLNLKRKFYDDVAALSGDANSVTRATITVLMPTSSAPSDPDTWHIEETLDSVRSRLPDAEIFVMIDGLHPQHEHRRSAYLEYTRRVLRLCHKYDAVPFTFTGHRHQAAMTRAALHDVRTPYVLFVEHDTPLLDHIDFERLQAAVATGEADVIRLHHEAQVHPEHRHLMLDVTPRDVAGAPLLRTVQWSQRPHLASTEFYRWMMNTYFSDDSRTMIEDVMHGVVQTEFNEFDIIGWEKFKLWMYSPDGDIKRSTHLDARGDEPKVPMTWAYEGPTPLGAPAPQHV